MVFEGQNPNGQRKAFFAKKNKARTNIRKTYKVYKSIDATKGFYDLTGSNVNEDLGSVGEFAVKVAIETAVPSASLFFDGKKFIKLAGKSKQYIYK